MYNIEEKPTAEIELGKYSATYSTNIETMLNIPYMDRVILRETNEALNDWVDFVQKQIEFFPQKKFYIPDRLFKSICPLGNCKEYSSFKFNDQKKEYSKLLFLDIDLDMECFDPFFDKLQDVIKGKGYTCIVFFDCKKKVRGEKIHIVLEKLQMLSNICEVLLSNQSISTESIIRHPCNAYLCFGNRCHSGKSPYPRFLHISDKGIFPYGCRNKIISFCGNIAFEDINDFSGEFSEAYLSSEAYQTFLAANKRIYRRYIVSSHFKVLPWNVFLEKVL